MPLNKKLAYYNAAGNKGMNRPADKCGKKVNTCASGTFMDPTEDKYAYHWLCGGGGSWLTCKQEKPQKGVCQMGVNTCAVGSFKDIADSTTSINGCVRVSQVDRT